MSLPATEPFTGGAGALAGSWTQHYAAQSVNKNGAGLGTGSTASAEAYARWNADTFDNDQYAQCVFKSGVSNTSYVEITVRGSGTEGTTNNYAFYTDSASGAGHTEIAKYVNNTQTILRNFATTVVANDVLRVEVSAGVLTAYKNGGSLGTQADGSHASGAAGCGSYDLPTFDDWEGGNMVVGAAADPNTYAPWHSKAEWRGGMGGGTQSRSIGLQRGERG